MAIDSTLFAAQVPAGTYAVGDRISLGVVRGPAVVRDGYGKATLKRVITMAAQSTVGGIFKIVVKNSNWVDEMSNVAISPDAVFLSNESASIQRGQDADLYPNSGWEVYAECIWGTTTTAATDLLCLIDIDYPSVAAVQNPRDSKGLPVTIDGVYTTTITANGGSANLAWSTHNVDILKAGSKYMLTEIGYRDTGTSTIGFVAISGAAAQAGLERIIPCNTAAQSGLKFSFDYATPLVKGPMNIGFAAIGTAGASTGYVYLDFVKKGM